MTRYLVSDSNPAGSKLEEILSEIRKDVIVRCSKIIDDARPEAQHVLANNIQILTHLTEAIELAEESTEVLDKSFGPSKSNEGGPPRIGEP